MDVRTGSPAHDHRAGFTLMELLLAVGLVLLLVSAMVFNFSGLQRDASLDEGARQIEALIRFARAHAASSGRHVQIAFEEDVGDGLMVPLGDLRVLWEPDPVARPGYFEPVTELQEYVHRITELVSIEGVRLVEDNRFEPDSTTESVGSGENSEGGSPVAFPPIGFFPDGSSDSAEILMASRTDEDTRRIAVRLQGITGSTHRQLITDEIRSGPEESAAQPAALEPKANADSTSIR